MSNQVEKQNVEVRMGLGEAMLRLNSLQSRIQSGVADRTEREEYKMILEALNNVQVNVGFDCNNDGVPDTVEIFEQSASTSCCRLIEFDNG